MSEKQNVFESAVTVKGEGRLVGGHFVDAPPPPKWEYQVETIRTNMGGALSSSSYDDELTARLLNDYGLGGWELCGVVQMFSKEHRLYFKRKRQ